MILTRENISEMFNDDTNKSDVEECCKKTVEFKTDQESEPERNVQQTRLVQSRIRGPSILF